MKGLFRKNIALLTLLLLLGVFFTQKANAASLTGVSDTVTTSRPSASAPIFASGGNQAAGAGQVTIFDNGSYFIASDSAILKPDTGETLNTVNIASMSAANTPSANQRVVYFTNTAANAHHQGDPLIVPVTAKHTVTFTTISTIPSGGKIIITFPGAANNTASPSATTFAFNSLAAANVTFTGTSACPTGQITVSAPTITCTTNASIAGASTITVAIGSSTPALINPTKSPSQACVGSTTCTADTWKVAITTQDSGSITLDTGSARIATIESIQVQGTVEPTITFTITGFASGTDVNGASVTNGGCGASILSNSGVAATATFVDLGSFGPNFLNKAIQGLTVSTNGASGYAITATSSGRFINPATGQFFQDANGGNGLTANDTPVPAVISITGGGTQTFGIHACGARTAGINSDQWVNAGTAPDSGSNGTAKFSNPWNTGTNAFYDTIASYTGGPVSAETTGIVYAGTITATTPPGVYRTVYTYVATSTF